MSEPITRTTLTEEGARILRAQGYDVKAGDPVPPGRTHPRGADTSADAERERWKRAGQEYAKREGRDKP